MYTCLVKKIALSDGGYTLLATVHSYCAHYRQLVFFAYRSSSFSCMAGLSKFTRRSSLALGSSYTRLALWSRGANSS